MYIKVRAEEVAGGVERSRNHETGGFYIAGVMGAGKTALLSYIIDQVMAAQELTRRTRQRHSRR